MLGSVSFWPLVFECTPTTCALLDYFLARILVWSFTYLHLQPYPYSKPKECKTNVLPMVGIESISKKIIMHCAIFAFIYCNGKAIHHPCSQGVAYVTNQMIVSLGPTYNTKLWWSRSKGRNNLHASYGCIEHELKP